MPDLAVINLTRPSPWILKPLPGGLTPLEKLCQTLGTVPGIGGWLILLREGFELPGVEAPVPVVTDIRTDWNEQSLLDAINGASDGYANLLHIWGDAPLLDPELIQRLYTLHTEGFAQFTFADGYPFGFAPEILTVSLVAELPRLLTPRSVTESLRRDLFFRIIQRDINSFDIETEIAPEDYRLLRLSFTADCLQNHLLLSRFVEQGAQSLTGILPMIRKHPEYLRTRPFFYQIQVSDTCLQRCVACPWPLSDQFRLKSDPGEGAFMDPGRFRDICKRIQEFSGNAVLSLSLTGEPSCHPEILELVKTALSYPDFRVLIETSGLGWDTGSLFAAVQDPDRLMLIVSLDALDPGLYRQLRGEGQDEAVRFAREALEHWPASVWVQGVRMTENEEDLEQFYRHWKETTENIIIQKYSTFGGRLPDRKVTDLSPLERFPCWALQREISIALNGDVYLCRNTVDTPMIKGNVFKHSLPEIWNALEQDWQAHVRGDYGGPCTGCDEYYAFNF